MMCSTARTSTAYCRTERQFRSVCTTTFATLRWTNSSPGSRSTISLAGTRLSEHPIQRYFGVCCWASVSKNCGSRDLIRCAHLRLLANRWSSEATSGGEQRTNLADVVAEVLHVILHQERDADLRGTVRRQCRSRRRIVRRARDDVSEMAVVGAPQRDEIPPRHLVVMLPRDPIILDISVEAHRLRRLAENKAAMVIARRVDEVPEHFARTPSAGGGPTRGARFVDLLKQLERFADG